MLLVTDQEPVGEASQMAFTNRSVGLRDSTATQWTETSLESSIKKMQSEPVRQCSRTPSIRFVWEQGEFSLTELLFGGLWSHSSDIHLLVRNEISQAY